MAAAAEFNLANNTPPSAGFDPTLGPSVLDWIDSPSGIPTNTPRGCDQAQFWVSIEALAGTIGAAACLPSPIWIGTCAIGTTFIISAAVNQAIVYYYCLPGIQK